MDYKLKYLKYKDKVVKLEKKIYEYIEKNNIDIKNVYKLINKQNNKDNDDIFFNYNNVSDNDMLSDIYKNLK